MDLSDTLAPASLCRHLSLRLETQRPTEFIDLTDRLEALVRQTGVHCGFVNIQTVHTTTAVVVNELEPLLLDDFSFLLEYLASRHIDYRHDDVSRRTENVTPDERVNGHAHCRALLLGASVCLNVVDGCLRLGRWQRVLFAELDGPRERILSVTAIGAARE
jgi:secondary thiamine-phosphate synthase enzyme